MPNINRVIITTRYNIIILFFLILPFYCAGVKFGKSPFNWKESSYIYVQIEEWKRERDIVVLYHSYIIYIYILLLRSVLCIVKIIFKTVNSFLFIYQLYHIHIVVDYIIINISIIILRNYTNI